VGDVSRCRAMDWDLSKVRELDSSMQYSLLP
jgi:hypothetical protein